jgi:hypothetical protein
MIDKVYLGDSVYAEFDNQGVTLTTENGTHNDPSNRIVLEWNVLNLLVETVRKLRT